jgi:thiamine pyrophosphate-dependent acetolactate synthase large subunit-like protein
VSALGVEPVVHANGYLCRESFAVATGNQASPSRHLRLDRVAATAGYRTVAALARPDGMAAALRRALTSEAPHCLLVKVTTEEADVPRIPHSPAAIRDRFRESLRAR